MSGSILRSALRRALPIRYLSAFRGRSAAIIRYHSVHSDVPGDLYGIPPTISHHVELFQSQIEMVSKNFNIIDMNTISSTLNSGAHFPRRSVALTFDDGYRNNLTLVAPILERFNIQGTFYVLSESIDTPIVPWFCQTYEYFRHSSRRHWYNPISCTNASLDTPEDRNTERQEVNGALAKMDHDSRTKALEEIRSGLGVKTMEHDGLLMNREDLSELIARGHSVGSHTHSHPNLALVSKDEAKFQIIQSRNTLEQAFPNKIQHFCFPNPFHQPHWSKQVCNLVDSAGYASAVTCTHGVITRSSNKYTLPRIAVPYSVEQLKWDLNRAFARI